MKEGCPRGAPSPPVPSRGSGGHRHAGTTRSAGKERLLPPTGREAPDGGLSAALGSAWPRGEGKLMALRAGLPGLPGLQGARPPTSGNPHCPASTQRAPGVRDAAPGRGGRAAQTRKRPGEGLAGEAEAVKTVWRRHTGEINRDPRPTPRGRRALTRREATARRARQKERRRESQRTRHWQPPRTGRGGRGPWRTGRGRPGPWRHCRGPDAPARSP